MSNCCLCPEPGVLRWVRAIGGYTHLCSNHEAARRAGELSKADVRKMRDAKIETEAIASPEAAPPDAGGGGGEGDQAAEAAGREVPEAGEEVA